MTVGLLADLFVTSKVNAEAGFSMTGYHIGGKYFFIEKEYGKRVFYFGANYFCFNFTLGGSVVERIGDYFPIGSYFI